MTVALRLLATAMILVPVYRETGAWTVTLLAMMTVGNELHMWLHRTEEHP